MIIIVNMDIDDYNKIKHKELFGESITCDKGFIHASTKEQFKLIATRFENKQDKTLILEINADKLKSQVKWEFSSKFNDKFPHIYGLINNSAVEKAYLLKDMK